MYTTGFLECVCKCTEVTHVTSLERLRFDALRHPYNESNGEYWMSKHKYTKVACVGLERHIKGVHFSYLNSLRVPVCRGYMYRCVLTQYARGYTL